MATTFIGCEACGTPVAAPAQLGVLIRRYYCEEHAELVKAALQRRDEIHTACAQDFRYLTAASRAELVAALPEGAKLPDEP